MNRMNWLLIIKYKIMNIKKLQSELLRVVQEVLNVND